MSSVSWAQWASASAEAQSIARSGQSCAAPVNCGCRLNARATHPHTQHRAGAFCPSSLRKAAAAVLAASLLTCPHPAQAEQSQLAPETSESTAPTVYFGNGCFWGRQKDFTEVERRLGRQGSDISAVVGYAGGATTGKDGRVCYYYGSRDSVYEALGHAEVTQLELTGDLSSPEAQRQMAAFSDAYFKQFRRTPFGMIRLDPQDAGPAYRNIIGLPGGTSSPLFQVLKDHNVNKMELLEGTGNDVAHPGREGDKINKVFIVDSDSLPFHKAELYHQYHNGIGVPFSRDYTQGMKQTAQKAGRIGTTGCPEFGPM